MTEKDRLHKIADTPVFTTLIIVDIVIQHIFISALHYY